MSRKPKVATLPKRRAKPNARSASTKNLPDPAAALEGAEKILAKELKNRRLEPHKALVRVDELRAVQELVGEAQHGSASKHAEAILRKALREKPELSEDREPFYAWVDVPKLRTVHELVLDAQRAQS